MRASISTLGFDFELTDFDDLRGLAVAWCCVDDLSEKGFRILGLEDDGSEEGMS